MCGIIGYIGLNPERNLLYKLRLLEYRGYDSAGIAVLESPVPAEELIIVDLEDDELRLDGSMAIAWSDALEFTVERAAATLVGSAASGEGLVNVYRGTGRVLIAPVARNAAVPAPKASK